MGGRERARNSRLTSLGSFVFWPVLDGKGEVEGARVISDEQVEGARVISDEPV